MTTISDTPLFPNDQTEFTPGDTVVISSQRFVLGDCLGHGGEGSVFEIEGKAGVVAKLYHRYIINKRQLEKLKLIVKANIASKVLIAPMELVFDTSGNTIGYTMRQASGTKLDELLITNSNSYTRREIVSLAINIAKAYQELDTNKSYNILAGDINLNNIIVSNKTVVQLVDLDSIQINDFPCPVGFPGFSLPSAMGKNYRDFLRTIENEQFAFAVLLFFLLIHKHPFDQINGEDPDENIKKLPFPYVPDPGFSPNAPTKFVFRWKTLTPNLQKAFATTFASIKSGRFVGYSFEDWIKYLIEYHAMLDKAVQRYKLIDVYDLNADAFSETRVCPACGKAFNPNGSSPFCPSCQKLDIVTKRCANPYCATPGKNYYVPRKSILSVNYCKDCLQPVRVKCKRCCSVQHAQKYQAHSFDVLYCSTHRGAAKGRLTKAKNRITNQLDSLRIMFESGNYSNYIINSALEEFRKIKANLMQDNDVDSVTPVLGQLELYIADLSLFQNEYVSWLRAITTPAPRTGADLSTQLQTLNSINVAISTLKKSWRNSQLEVANTLGGRLLKIRVDEKLKTLGKIKFKKCACCGREERDDSYISGSTYYCSSCLSPVTVKCPRCGISFLRQKYVINKLEPKTRLCTGCTNDYNSIVRNLSNNTAYGFSQVNSFVNLDFDKREKDYKDYLQRLAFKTKDFAKCGVSINVDQKRLKEELLLVISEKHLKDAQNDLKSIVASNINNCSYKELQKYNDSIDRYLHAFNNGSVFEGGKAIRFAALAPTAMAIKEFSEQKARIQKRSKELIKNFEEELKLFESYKNSLFHLDLTDFSWQKRLKEMGEKEKYFLRLFEDYSGQKEAAYGNAFIENSLAWLKENEKKYLEKPIQLLQEYSFQTYSLEDSAALKKGIEEISEAEKNLKQLNASIRNRLILLIACEEKLKSLREYMEVLESILDTSFFYDIDEYCEKPIQDWKQLEMREMTLDVIEKTKAPQDFVSLVESSYYEKISVITQFESIKDKIHVYVDSLKKDFKQGFSQNYLSVDIPKEISEFEKSNYDCSELRIILESAKSSESKLKEDYISNFASVVEKWKKERTQQFLTSFSSIFLPVMVYLYSLIKGETNAYVTLFLAISFVFAVFFSFVRKKSMKENVSIFSSIISATLFFLKWPWDFSKIIFILVFSFALEVGRSTYSERILGKRIKFRFDEKDRTIFKKEWY